MKLLGKDLGEYVSAIKIPLLAVVVMAVIGLGWNIVSAIMGLAGPLAACSGIASLILSFGYLVIYAVLAVYCGYSIAKKQGTLIQSAVGGAMFGIVVMVVSLITGIIGAVIATIASGIAGNIAAGIIGAVIGVVIAQLLLLLMIVVDAILAAIGGVIGGAK